jgi:hypothetical protein
VAVDSRGGVRLGQQEVLVVSVVQFFDGLGSGGGVWFRGVVVVLWCDLDLVASGRSGRVSGMVWWSGGCLWLSVWSGHTVISQLARMSERTLNLPVVRGVRMTRM